MKLTEPVVREPESDLISGLVSWILNPATWRAEEKGTETRSWESWIKSLVSWNEQNTCSLEFQLPDTDQGVLSKGLGMTIRGFWSSLRE